jgi:hypothetical protein
LNKTNYIYEFLLKKYPRKKSLKWSWGSGVIVCMTSKWIYKIKHIVDGSIERHGTRFVAKGFSQVEGIDYEETSPPLARYTSIRMIIFPATSMG